MLSVVLVAFEHPFSPECFDPLCVLKTAELLAFVDVVIFESALDVPCSDSSRMCSCLAVGTLLGWLGTGLGGLEDLGAFGCLTGVLEGICGLGEGFCCFITLLWA